MKIFVKFLLRTLFDGMRGNEVRGILSGEIRKCRKLQLQRVESRYIACLVKVTG